MSSKVEKEEDNSFFIFNSTNINSQNFNKKSPSGANSYKKTQSIKKAIFSENGNKSLQRKNIQYRQRQRKWNRSYVIQYEIDIW